MDTVRVLMEKNMKGLLTKAVVMLVLSASVISQTAVSRGSEMMGFATASAAAQSALEARFDSLLKAENLAAWNKRLSAAPHHIGSPYNKINAEFIAAQFRSWGYETEIERFDVLFPTPKTRLVEVTSPEKFTMRLNEPAVEGDATSGQQDRQLPTYNAYSID